MVTKGKTIEQLVSEARAVTSEGVPGGYIRCMLSSRGKLGAPELFHCRNFMVEDLMDMSLVDDSERPIKVCETLQQLIWEKDVKIADFHEKEVIELLVLLYYCFYGTVFSNMQYEPDEADWKFLADSNGGEDSEEYQRARQQYKTGKWKPVFDIDLNALEYWEVADDFKSTALMKKPSGFSCKYTYPRYGDLVTMRDFVAKIWAEEDRQHASVAEILRFRRDAENRIRQGEEINLRNIPNIPKATMDEYVDYERRKATFIAKAVRGLHLVEYKGRDVSKDPIEARIALAEDPEIDFSTFDMIATHFNEIKVGIKDTIKVRSPVQGKIVERRYSFRIDTVFQALRDAKPAGVTVQFV
jgi:hypothetical protein